MERRHYHFWWLDTRFIIVPYFHGLADFLLEPRMQVIPQGDRLVAFDISR